MSNNLNKISQHKGFIKYFKNTSGSLIEQFLRIVVGFFIWIWIIRYLGPEQFGVYSYVISFTMVFTILARLGLSNIIVKEMVDHGNINGKLMNTAFVLKLIGGISIYVLMLFVSFLFKHDYLTNLYIAIIGFGILFQSLEVVEFYYQAQVNIKPVVIAKVFQLLFSSLIKIYLLIIEADLLSFVKVALLDVVMLAFFYILMYKKFSNQAINFEYDGALMKRLFSLSWPIALSNMAMIAYTKMDQIMLFNLIDARSVGFYASATKISEAWYFLPTIITATLFPAILNARNISKILYEERVKSLFSLMIFFSIIIAIPVTLYADNIIRVLYGKAFAEAGLVLGIHIWVGLFIALGMVASRWFVAENLQKLFLIRTLTGLVVNFILNLLLIPLYGIVGAAIATLISVIFANILAYLFNKKLWPLFVLTIKSFNLFGLYRFIRTLK